MGTEEKIGRLQAHQKKLRAYKHAMNLLNYDGSTLMPSGGADYLSDTLEILSGEEYGLRTAPETGELLRELSQVKDQLDFQTRREVEELLREQERLLRVPKEEVMAMESAARPGDGLLADSEKERRLSGLRSSSGKADRDEKAVCRVYRAGEAGL